MINIYEIAFGILFAINIIIPCYVLYLAKNGIPSAQEEEAAVYTQQDPNFYDYTKASNFTKKTGIELDDFHSFVYKELVDNAEDFVETHCKGYSPTIRVYISNHPAIGFRIAVVNPNDEPAEEVFTSEYIRRMFNYKVAFSSKSNQYRITRGAQGVALKQLATLAYMQYDKDWNEPIIFQHNGTVDKVYVSVDRKSGKIIPRFEKGRDEQLVLSNNDTKIVLTLPVAMTQTNYRALIKYCKEYTLPNTHIGYEFHFNDDYDNDDGLVISLPAQHPISRDYKNLNSISCYDEQDFYDFLNDLAAADSSTTFYKAVNGFREIKQKDNRFEYLKTMTLKHGLTEETSIRLYTQLKASMQPMSRISDPYDSIVKSRRDALLGRYLQIKPTDLDVDLERAIYVRTKDPKTKGDIIHKDSKNGTRFPYRFEVLAIPIKGENAQTKVISSVNYSTSINNISYFTSDHYVYKWTAKRTGDLLYAYDIKDIIKKCMAGHMIDYNKPVPNAKLKQECVFICHLISPKIQYSNGYGKSSLVLQPFSKAIAETIQDAILKIPSKPKYTGLSKKENKAIPSIHALVYKVLLRRWIAVQANPGIIDSTSIHYDPWSLSTVFYITRDEEALRLEAKYHISLIKIGTRKQITSMVSDLCAELPGSPKLEQLEIFASPRASLYFAGTWHDVDVREIPNLADKGTVVVFVEKRGVADQIKHLADLYGVAIVNTTGHLPEYAKELIPAIVKEDGYVAILTDFDCAGINIAEKVIEEIINILGEEVVSKRVKRLGLFMEDLERFIIKYNNKSQKLKATMVEEPYPKQSKQDKQQQPGTNVMNSIIEYAADYWFYEGYERFEYIYNSFEYLTGIDPNDIITVDYKNATYPKKDEKAVKELIDNVLADRDPTAARRIELDNVIKVVGANRFGEFVMDKLVEFFPEWNYNRAAKTPTDYIGERFHILPESTKKYFAQFFDIADKAAEEMEEEIESDLEHVKGKLRVDAVMAENERLLCEAVAADPDVQRLDKEHSKLSLLLLSLGNSNCNSSKNNEILYDLTNKNWEFVRITSEGWSVVKSTNTPIFKRYKNQLAQVYPSKEYDSDIFDQFMNLLNIKDANSKLLLKIYIILLIYNKIQKPILAPYGEQGSAKSTLHEYIKQVIDPSAAITLAFPKDVNELIQKLDHNYLAYFDNVSRIPEWISDQFCRAVTGSGFSKRQLYTDEDDIIFSFKRALGFNGINLAATKADLLDRCLIILLERRTLRKLPIFLLVNI